MLKPFATIDDQKVWRERISNLLAQREQAHTDIEKKDPPCMACYTKVPDLSKKVMDMNAQEEEIVPPGRLTLVES